MPVSWIIVRRTMEKLNLKYSAQQPAQGMRTFYHNNLHGIFPLPGL